MSGTLVIAAKGTSMSMARKVEIVGIGHDEALKFAETWIVNFMRTTAGDVTISWAEGA